MLNGIRQMIQEKTAFLEAADIIFEDGSGMNLDDRIILGESNEDDIENDLTLHEDGDSEPEGNVGDGENNETPTVEEPTTGDGNNDEGEPNLEDLPIDDGSENSVEDNPTATGDTGTDDLLNSDIDSPETVNDEPAGSVGELPGSDLPEPVGAQTGEPINPVDDILNVELDLGSNTVKDVLPVPPAGAGEVVPTEDNEQPTQHVDSGFGREAAQEAEENHNEPSYVESYFNSIGLGNTPFQEAITLAGDGGESTPEAKPEESTTDGTSDSMEGELPVEDPTTEESPVTTAVKDKVSESDESEDIGIEGGSEAKLDILKKLSNITKNIEDAKKAVMNSIQ